jgi:hypothetical protein
MKSRFPSEKPVFFSPLSTFSLTPDIVPFQNWDAALNEFKWVNIGAKADHYPSDPRALIHWADPLRKWVQENPQPIQDTLTAEELLELSGSLGKFIG